MARIITITEAVPACCLLHLQCSVECGIGTKNKVQRCARVYKPEVRGAPKKRVYIDDSYCKRLKVRKPLLRKSTKVCKINCKWVFSKWTRCSSDCTEEYQTRYVRCEAWQGNSVSERYCDAKKRPIQRKICDNCVQRRFKVLSPVSEPNSGDIKVFFYCQCFYLILSVRLHGLRAAAHLLL